MHLLRKFVAFSERAGPSATFGCELLNYTGILFEYWHDYQAGRLDRATFPAWIAPVRAQVEDLLERAVASNIERLAGSCADILEHRLALWTFVDRDDVQPTNNHSHAAHGITPAVPRSDARRIRNARLYRSVRAGSAAIHSTISRKPSAASASAPAPAAAMSAPAIATSPRSCATSTNAKRRLAADRRQRVAQAQARRNRETADAHAADLNAHPGRRLFEGVDVLADT